MEPKILLVGRNLQVIEMLIEELRKVDRNVLGANSKELIESHLKEGKVDFVVVGAGLPDETRTEWGRLYQGF